MHCQVKERELKISLTPRQYNVEGTGVYVIGVTAPGCEENMAVLSEQKSLGMREPH
jgi:hypothetical protein